MECPDCGNTDLLPKFKCCPECGAKLPRVSSTEVPRSGTSPKDGREAIAQESSLAQLTDTGDKSDLRVDKGRFESDNSHQGERATVSKHDVFSAAQSDGHSSAAAINSDQSRNPPADKGLGAIDIQGTADRRPENPTGEGVKIESSILTDQYRQQRETPVERHHDPTLTQQQQHPQQRRQLPQRPQQDQHQQKLPVDRQQYNQQQQMPSADQQHYNQQQQMPSADRQYYNQQQQMPSADRQHYNQQQQMPTADQQHYNLHQQMPSANRQRYNQHQQMPSPDQQHYNQHQQMPSADRQHYNEHQQKPSADRQHYNEHQQKLSADRQLYNQHQQKPSADRQHYNEHQQKPSADRQHYNQHQQKPSADRQHYSQHQQKPSADRQHYNQHQQMPSADRQHYNQHKQMPPTGHQHYNQHQHLQQNQQKQPPPGGQVFDQQQQPSSSTKQQHQQVDRQQCLNAESISDDKRAEGVHPQAARKAPGSTDQNKSSQASQNRRGRDDPTTQTPDQRTKMPEGGIEGKESNTVNEGDSRRATENIGTTPVEKVESTALVLSAAPEEPARSDTVLGHPLSEQLNEDNGSEASNTNKGGHWYQKPANTPQDAEAGQGKKKASKKQGKEKGGGSSLPTAQNQHTLKQVDPENGVTVVFHVLLESNFKMEDESLHIRAGARDLGEFYINCVDLISVGNCTDQKKLMRFSGQFTLSVDCARQGTSYKYVVLKKGNVHWEGLLEFPSRYPGGIVNRFLSIPKKYLKPGGKWDQIDGVAYIYGERNWWDRFYDNYIRRKETAENRTQALLTHLPKWKGFLLNEPVEKMTATEALVELDRVVSCLFTSVFVQEGHFNPEKKRPNDINIETVLSELLQPKLKDNSTVLAQSKMDLIGRASALVSSLAIVLLVKKYGIDLPGEDKLLLLKCLTLEVDPSAKRCTAYEVVLEEFSEGLRARAAEGIEDLCNEVMANAWKADREWVFAIPLLHFLREDSKPFEEPDIAGSYNKLEWIGAQKLRIREFQRWERQNLWNALPQLVSSFELDRLFKRTFLNAIPVWELHKVVDIKMFHVSDICVALVTFCQRESVPMEKWMDVAKCIQLVIKQMEEEHETAASSYKTLEFTTSICLKLLEICVKKLNFRDQLEIVCLLIRLLLTSIQRQRKGMAESSSEVENKTEEGAVINKLLKILRNELMCVLPPSMNYHYRSDSLLRELQTWSALLAVADENQRFGMYREYLINELTNRARRVSLNFKVEEKYLVEIFCEVQMDDLDKAVGETFTKLAFEGVEKIINSQKKGDAHRAFLTLSSSARGGASKAGKYGQLLSILLTKSWPKENGGTVTVGLDRRTVEFLLTWNPMTGYLKFFGDGSERGAILTDEGQETLSMAKSLLEALIDDISNASVTVEILLLLKDFKQKFVELVKTTTPVVTEEEGRKIATNERIEQILNERIEEIDEFQAVKVRVLSFARMCDLIPPVNVGDIKFKASKDVSTFNICDLCERNDKKQIEVKFFELPQLVKDILLPLHKVQESSTFQKLWVQYGKKAQCARANDESKKRDLSILNVVEIVWKPAYEAWTQLVEDALDGSLTLMGVDKFFEGYKNRREELVKELRRIFVLGQDSGDTTQLKKIAEKRVSQIHRYQQLDQYFMAAETIWDFKESMGFTGDFKVIEDVRNQLSTEFKQRQLNSIGKEFADAGRALKGLDVDKAGCFKAVVESMRLVEWLRKTITSPQELKVLVDLALITAGESDMETDRISSLHTSCLGFAPLIFDLKETKDHKVSFDQLMKACDPVWKAVEADKTLPKKLKDTSRHLEWLKTVKESHGSVAMTSLAQAKTINSNGVYLVGSVGSEEGPAMQSEGRPCLEGVVRLTVPLRDEEGNDESKIYSLDELKDLQSKLMLIAGKAEKGKDDVETFVKNLEGVMRLATAYLNLSESGFVHRMHWNQEFHCSKDQREGESISKELAMASTAMENCYLNWKKKVSDTRKEYQELNFFTTQQMMLLRRKIAIACRRSDLHVDNLQILTLLESVRTNVDTELLKAAIQRAFKDTGLLDQIKRMEDLPSFSLTPSQEKFDTSTSLFENNNYVDRSLSTGVTSPQVQSASIKKEKPKDVSKIQRFLNAAEDEGYSEQVALSALASLGVDAEEDDLLLWCLEESDDADLESLYEEAMANPLVVREIYPQEVLDVQEIQLGEASGALRQSENAVEKSPMPAGSITDEGGDMNEDNETEISEYLTLAQLGSILRELAVKGKGTKPRVFPAFLKRGRPNLMLVPKGDVLATVLALYMHDKHQPLPSHEEVLICTPETTAEEVELLWRRAIGDLEGGFYCLVHADQLDFSVSKQAIDKLGVLTQGLAGKMGENYGLVVMCSSENEDRANIVAALDQYRVAAPPCPSSNDLQSYLKKHFRIPPPQYGYINRSKITWEPAGTLDPEKLCVRVVTSNRGGLGKTLYVRRLTDQLQNLVNNDMVVCRDSGISLHVTVPLHGNSTDSSMLVDSLLPHATRANVPLSRVFHLDVSPSMRRGLDTLLFNLLVLGFLCDKMGRVWRRRMTDLYVIEITTASPLPTGFSREEEAESLESESGRSSKRPFYDLLPTIVCSTPRTVSCRLATTRDPRDINPLFDAKEFRSPQFQRVYQYLKLSKEGKNMDNFTFVPGNIDEDQTKCLSLMLSNCGIPDPSWAEIRHFVSFLNSQLRDCEQSFFCDMQLMRSVLAGPNVLNLEGFRSFVVRFMIQMSRDFATPSLTDQNTVFYTEDNAELERREIEQFQLRRSWETSPHPYLFFNEDRVTMTFLGFSINSAGDLIDPQTMRTLEKSLMSKQLRLGLQAQRVDFTANPENWKKAEKISQLCSVMGVKWSLTNPDYDPDRAYELTTDNVKKILAIHMRFRCNIPVLVMGETGCGKTRLIRYMCGLQAGPQNKDQPRTRNMLLVKVHGGTTYEDIEQKVRQAEDMARENQNKNIDTVLFFDEANTTEALSMIKEVMVDRRVRGQPIGRGLERLQFIAACNPYRRHTDDMIHKLESAGLGYHVKTDESDDRLGHIPLRHLVYRVHALPGSMRPLIWDFGQLNHQVESLYTNQIVSRYILQEHQWPGDLSTVQAVAAVLAASQKYMRDQSDECSFVSLRDVERAMQVMVWFYKHADTLGRLMKIVVTKQRREEGKEVDDDEEDVEPIDPMTRALVLAIGVCYHAKLQEKRQDYREVVAQSFKAPCVLPGGEKQILREITSCQRAVLNELDLGPNIARNTALSENVFMMVVCIELRIPLFVVGKPGSSKSLAKTVVADNMQGDAAKSKLFRNFKQVHMASFQCSPLSTPEGIVATFRQCSKLQEGKNLESFVSVVVLDEVGLAEDSPLMPLKTLHPLLEDGVTSSDDVIETDEKPQRVAFIGISNWALDPAKMNRGIMLSRGVPDVKELVDSALGICSTDEQVKLVIQTLISPLAEGYAELYREQKNFPTLQKCGKEEFFGLRDFYSLVKMVYAIAAKSGQRPMWNQLEHAIRRNFGGLVEGEPVEIFKRRFQIAGEDENKEAPTALRLIEASLRREDVADQTNFSENRYLLILTENYAALRIIQQHLLKTSEDAVVIFGSSFPNDQEYTQICRNINRIKVCMETGRTVILLNLESLYESLYDALNQYYVYFGGQKYVDLGLGTHRVKCRVHDDFRLIVIAEKDVVYNNFPIPLINRLEKHFLVTSTSLTPDQMELVGKLRIWANDFAEVSTKRSRDFTIGDAFVGYHEDTIPTIVMQVCNDLADEDSPSQDEAEDPWEVTVARRCKNMLLQMATPDAIARLPASGLKGEAREMWQTYFREQQHSSLAAFMRRVLTLEEKREKGLFIQVTTHSRLLSNHDLDDLCSTTDLRRSTVDVMTLQQFQTEQQFRSLVRTFFEHLGGDCSGILVVQCDSGDDNFNLIAGARHILMEENKNAPELLNLSAIAAVHIVLVIQLPRIAGGCRNFVGFQGGNWISTHIDELRPPERYTPSIEDLIDRPISKLFGSENAGQQNQNDGTRLLAVKFLRNCVQAAACRIDDEGESTVRSTERIELLLHLLPEDFDGREEKCTFASVLTQRTFYLLEETESTAYNAHGWLHSEALSGTGVQEWGTFRKALWKRIYSAVVPILAEIIAFADRDRNLDLMKDGNVWVSTLWLKIMVDPNISELSYSTMISPVTNSVRERVPVIGSGAGGHSFQCLFPFSFIVRQRVDKMLKDAFSVTAQSSATLVEALRDLIDDSELGPLLRELPREDFPALRYLTDFVHMVYKSSSESEHQLVCEAILSSARELGFEEDEMIDIALVHVAHSRIQSRLRCFSKLVQAKPEVIEKLKEVPVFREKQAELLLDVVTLQVCLEELTSSEDVLLGQESRGNWCDRVLSIRQAVEDMMRRDKFGASTEEYSSYGKRATVLLNLCRSMWQRAGAVRLFVEHVTLLNESDDDEVNSESVVTLWKALGEEANFSSLRSLQTIEKFLINCTEDTRNRGNNSSDSELRRRCNAFFMELVSLFCFGESCDSLEAEALSLLMRYVTGQHSAQTKDFSPFPDYGIDTTPVVRSFLLQQLLRSSTKLVKEHLEAFLKEAQSLKPDSQHVKEVCFLCVQCMEDNMISRYQAKVSDSKLTVKLKHAKKICEEAFKALSVNSDKSFDMSADTLEAVAKGRYVLNLVADYMFKYFIEGDSSYRDLDARRELISLLESARRFCVEGSSSTPQLYLLKQLVRLYGFDCVRTLGGYQELEWVLPLEARQQEENFIQDRFLVHELHYRTIREEMAKAVISGNTENITAAITETEMQSGCKEVLILLALYREITLTNGSLQRQNISEEVKEKLDGFIQNGGHISVKVQPFAKQLVKNNQGDQFKELRVFPGKSSQDHTLAEIVMHTSAALQCFGPGSLSEPLAALMMEPSKLTNSYLPTMPEDNFAECIAVIAETMKATGRPGEWYECGNCKHPYFIGECSKPMEKGHCPDCKKVIGGEQHRFLGEYKISDRADRTKTGHALGPPDSRPTTPEPQRNLSPIICSLLRIIMHSAMVMGACRNPQAASQLITPPCDPGHVAEFLWKHMQRDLNVLGRALGRSVDDAALTVHLVLHQMISLNGGQTANTHNTKLQTRESRRNWETDFSSVIIAPVLKQLDQRLQKCSKLVMEDEQFGSDPLVRTLYGFDEQKEDLNLGVKPMSRSLWKYRRQITVEHLANSFQQEALSVGVNQNKVLGAFLKQEHKLRSIQFLPDIVRLQRLLMDRFHRRIDRSDAEKFAIREFLKSLPRGAAKEEYVNLIQSFKMAWNSCHSFLGDQGRLRVPEDLCNTTMDNDCPIAMLLPSTTGMGVCSTALTFFLVNTHDEFLGTFRSLTNQESALERVPVTEVTISHLIAYDPEKDLLPLILAHCNYSLEVGKETSVQYDWAALERQLIDRFLRGRPFVDFREERFAFSRDTRDDTVFSSLAEKIPQEPISRVIEGQIITDLRSSLSDVCDVLSSLDIAIGFLASSGGQEGRQLKSYLHETLKLPKERGLKSPTAEQHCHLSHILALWRLMALEKAKIKSRNKQEPFEQMSDIFKEKLSSSDLAQLNRILRKIDMDLFLPRLLEMVLLNVKHAKENIVSMSFNEYFELYLEEKGLEQVPGTENISDDVKMKHLKAVWNAAVQLSDDFHKGSQTAAA